MKRKIVTEIINVELEPELPPRPKFQKGISRAPNRNLELNAADVKLALRNALRYLPEELHEVMVPEFLKELKTRGRIYGYRFRPAGHIYGHPINEYKGIIEAKALQVMIDNNLDFNVALYPYELVTYGETGQVFQNWMQYQLVKKYLQIMRNDQTLVISSGHPVGLFPSVKSAPRVISTNGLIVGQWDNPVEFKRLAALGVSNYGQMTAGGWMYIGTQGICHGTYITIINAARKYLNLPNDKNLAGICFVSSGLGGMSCAQPKAMKIAGGIAVVAEVDYSRIKQKLKQHWIDRVSNNLVEVEELILEYKKSGRPLALAYYGNIVDLLEYLSLCQVPIELISDQTSCHVVYEGGYTPVDFDFTSSRRLMDEDNPRFRAAVNDSLKRHFQAIGRMINQGSHFWDYGNSFMYAVMKSGEKRITKNGQDDRDGYIWPSYVEDIMGPLCFDYGFGPFRWVCLSGEQADLDYTDELALNLINPEQSSMHNDNYEWIAHAKEYNLVVGTKARILYNDEEGRIKIALAFNKAVRDERVGPIMIGRDHHDVSGTDSPSRETANIYDGSRPTADMSVQCFGGNIARGMTLVVLSNGGGVGIGLASNGGNGIVLDGSRRIDKIIKSGLSWDVMGGVARRNWARNPQAMATAKKWNKKHETSGQITIPNLVNNDLIDKAVSDAGLVQ